MALVQPGQTPEAAEQALIAEFERLKQEPVTDAELQRAKNQWARDYIIGRETDEDKARHLAHAAVIHNDITTADGEFDIFMRTTVADVQRVARTYFTETNRVVLHILPKKAPAGVLTMKRLGVGESAPRVLLGRTARIVRASAARRRRPPTGRPSRRRVRWRRVTSSSRRTRSARCRTACR